MRTRAGLLVAPPAASAAALSIGWRSRPLPGYPGSRFSKATASGSSRQRPNGASAQSTRRSTTSIEGSHVTPSLERSWWAVNVLP
jgi:hypothetical protein